ncbi:MAG TPA: type IV pilin N-terminal domain-containing protein [Methanomassiliicoccaceae archaeon]|nr:type IV pilin N-terminal domain-containing protein [Methanomassiliicoccaceae archaeon]HPT74012.1 type IV pilin N-terminal domain-containing protein [Methanomassiliicoccaceae archaeon]
MKRSWKDRKGVSPVIATILMVAITVVLAAVLYVMVMGLGDISTTPNGQITKVEKTGTGGYKLTLSTFSPSTKLTDIKVNVNGTLFTSSDGKTWVPDKDYTYEITVTDQAGDGKVSQGDYITVELAYGATVKLEGATVAILHGPSGGEITKTTLPSA